MDGFKEYTEAEQLDEGFREGYEYLVKKLLPAIAKKFSAQAEEIRSLGKPSEKVAAYVAKKYTPNGFADLGIGGLVEDTQSEASTELLVVAARVCITAFVGTAVAKQTPQMFAAWLLVTAVWLVASTLGVSVIIRRVFRRNQFKEKK